MVWGTEPSNPNLPEGIQQQISAINEQFRNSDEEGRTRAIQRLIDIWTTLKTVSPATEAVGADPLDVTMDDVLLQVAEHLARAPQAAPDTELGREVYSTLRAHLPTEELNTTDEREEDMWSTAPTPAWGGSTSNNSVEGIAALATRADWRSVHGDELATLLAPFLNGPDPVRRFLASRALPGLYPEPDELFDQVRRRLSTETDRHIAAYLFGLLSRFGRSQARDVDDVVRQLATRPEWACATVDPQADHYTGHDERVTLVINLLTALAVVKTTPYASSIIEVWLLHPIDHPNRATQTIAYLRYLLNPADSNLRPAQERAFQLLDLAVGPLRDAWAAPERPGQLTQDREERLTRAVKVAKSIGQQVYFASGAHESTEEQDGAQLRGDLRRFCSLALPLLERLAEIRYPAVTHHTVQTIDHLRSAQPRRALLIAARTVTGDVAYAHESLALNAVHVLIRHYLTDQRDLVLTDSTCMSAIRTMLEAYVRVGWDEAIELAEELDELFG